MRSSAAPAKKTTDLFSFTDCVYVDNEQCGFLWDLDRDVVCIQTCALSELCDFVRCLVECWDLGASCGWCEELVLDSACCWWCCWAWVLDADVIDDDDAEICRGGEDRSTNCTFTRKFSHWRGELPVWSDVNKEWENGLINYDIATITLAKDIICFWGRKQQASE